ncbi:hypothetical protein [Streptomyces sp. NPDC051180]|uniref:hypothetical protein n=1 Tax=unclassified Streptomyces TaxID=2593676 RepID=UPI00344D79F8
MAGSGPVTTLPAGTLAPSVAASPRWSHPVAAIPAAFPDSRLELPMRRIALLTCTAVAAVVAGCAAPQFAASHRDTAVTAGDTVAVTAPVTATATGSVTDSAGWQ